MSSSEIMTEDLSGSMPCRDQAGFEILKKAEGRAKMILIMKRMLLCEIQDLPTETRKENLRVFLEWLDLLYTASEYADWGDYKKKCTQITASKRGENGMLFLKQIWRSIIPNHSLSRDEYVQ